MKPYYEKDGIKIYHGDCRDILPLLSDDFDLLLTDPPYGIGEAAGKNKSRGCNAISRDYGIAHWDNATVPQSIIDCAVAMARHAIVFGGNYYTMPPSSCWLVWDKDNGKTDFADCELAWTNLPGAVRMFKYKWQGYLQEHRGIHKDDRVHPTQKPLRLMRWCIERAGDVKTVIDPFCGSATTLRAAKDLGCHAVGIEREEKYCEIAVQRLRQEVLFT